jgi:hypothetical protein
MKMCFSFPRKRLIENKLEENKLGVRDIRVAVDMQGIHRNSERPAYFQAWITVPDLYLPTKGTAYRANRHDDQQVKPGEVSEICSGELWRLQGLPFDMLPAALSEGDFRVPSAKAHLCAQDGRKNLTDLQETAQWLAGEAVTSSLLKALLGVLGLLSNMLFLYYVFGCLWSLLFIMIFKFWWVFC